MGDIILLDGGMGQELIARSLEPASPLWSAAVMEREPELVRAVHRDFAEAGASVITLNAYSATPERLARFMDAGEVEARFESLQRAAIDAALAVRAASSAPLAIAGCLPPLGGSYHPEAGPDFDTTIATYRRILAIQAKACDVIMAETMSSVTEARASAKAIAEAGLRGWIALSVDDREGTRLRSGEPLAEACEAVLEEGVEALLLNCSRPEAIEEGLGTLAAAARSAGLAFGAYANGFTNAAELAIGSTVDGMDVRTDLGPEQYARHALGWIERGATIVGGCCEVGPAHIARLHAEIEAAGHEVVAPLGGAVRRAA